MSPTLLSVVQQTADILSRAGIDSAALDARLLIAHALGISRAEMLTQGERLLSADEAQRIGALIARRAAYEPVSRILGAREFWSLPFGLNEATLDPRPDSETLVEMALGMAGSISSGRSEGLRQAPLPDPPHGGEGTAAGLPMRILDLGTGSGCLLLSLLHELPDACGIGIDIAPRAVEQAQVNAERLGLAERASFSVANWNHASLAELLHDAEFDLIVSNPPYIPRSDLAGLMPDVRDYDPRAALDGGEDGLDPYRLLIPQLPALLAPNGCAVFEVGTGQAQTVADIFRQAGFRDVSIRRDFGGIDRCVGGLKTMARNMP